MAFQRLTYIKNYTCLSTDVKPVVGIEAGSTCSEVDTGKEFIFSGTAWVQVITQTAITGSLPKSTMEHYGATINDRPAANSVPVGATFMVVGSTTVYQSNGTSWVVL